MIAVTTLRRVIYMTSCIDNLIALCSSMRNHNFSSLRIENIFFSEGDIDTINDISLISTCLWSISRSQVCIFQESSDSWFHGKFPNIMKIISSSFAPKQPERTSGARRAGDMTHGKNWCCLVPPQRVEKRFFR